MKIVFKLIALFLTVAILISTLSGCQLQKTQETTEIHDNFVETIVESILESIESQQTETTKPTLEDVVEVSKCYDYDRSYSIEEIAYSLMTIQLQYGYNVFPAFVTDSNENEIYGLAYYDYSDCYSDDAEENSIYIMCGFMPFSGEIQISEDDFNSGLVITDPEYQCEDITFVWKYRSDAVADHCVVYGQYLKYGVDSNGYLFYEVIDYSRDVCDMSLGSLYSLDEGKYLYDLNVGEYIPIVGESLTIEFDYEQFEKDINTILAKQDDNFQLFDTYNALYISYDAVCNVLMGLSDETFMGYKASDLFAIAQEIDPKTCIEISPEGLLLTEIADPPDESASALTRWLVGTACVLVSVSACVASYCLSIYLTPTLSGAIMGLVLGVTIDIFMQVVFCGKPLDGINWGSVAISAISGAISGALNPTLLSTLGEGTAKYFVADSLVDGLLGGVEYLVLGIIEGENGIELIKSFGYGFVLGAVLSSAFKGIGTAFKAVAPKIKNMSKLVADRFPDLIRKMSKFATSISDPFVKSGKAIGKKIDDLKRIVDKEAIQYAAARIASGKRVSQTVINNIALGVSQKEAISGSKKVFAELGYDWNTIQKLKKNTAALENYLKSIDITGKNPYIVNTKQLISLAQERYLPVNGKFVKFFDNSVQSTGDSAEWYLYLAAYNKGYKCTKEYAQDLSQYQGKHFDLFGVSDTLKGERKTDLLIEIQDGTNVHTEIKVGKPNGNNGRQSLRQELIADYLRMLNDVRSYQNYQIFKSATTGKSLLDDPEQVKYLIKMKELFPDRVNIYFEDQLMQIEDLMKYVK